MAFWIAAGLIGVAVMALLLLALMRSGTGGHDGEAEDLRVYRDQLAEIDRDLARGVVAADDAGRARAEVSRRMLDADRGRRGAASAEPPRQATLVMAGVVGIVMAGAVWTYAARLGAPGYPDLPIAARLAMADEVYRTRPGQAEAEAAAKGALPAPPEVAPEFAALMEQLRAALKDRPDDLQGHQLLARNEAALGNYAAAIAAQQQVIALKGASVSAGDHAALAEVMILAAGGYVSPEAEAELGRAVGIDPLEGTAVYYLGLMALQTGRPDRAFQLWEPLLARSAPGDPWVAPLRAQIGLVAEAAGVRFELPVATPGPTAEDMEAAAAMTPEEREQMIRGMVDGLNQRLATEGGTAEEWARLIGAYGTLGETARAIEIWTEAQARFAGRDDDLRLIRAAAEAAGVSTPSLSND